jgi:hypothetical protein
MEGSNGGAVLTNSARFRNFRHRDMMYVQYESAIWMCDMVVSPPVLFPIFVRIQILVPYQHTSENPNAGQLPATL